MKFLVLCEFSLIREGLSNLLRNLEIGSRLDVVEVEGFEALSPRLAAEGDVDLIFFYTKLDPSAWDLLEQVKEAAVEVPILFVADFTSDKEIRRAIQIGVNGCVSTEFTWRTVATLVVRILEGEIVSPPLKYKVTTGDGASSGRTLSNAPKAPHKAASSPFDNVHLTPRQLDVLNLIKMGKSNKEIARDLEVSEGTVKIHCAAIFKELGVTNRTQAALFARGDDVEDGVARAGMA
ncbi:MAG: DNA-binding response regulator [Thiotrichales bacterium]